MSAVDGIIAVRLGGCASAAYGIQSSRSSVMDLRSALLQTEDALRQIRVAYRVLGTPFLTSSSPFLSREPSPRPAACRYGEEPQEVPLVSEPPEELSCQSLVAVRQREEDLPSTALSESHRHCALVPVPTVQRPEYEADRDDTVKTIAQDALHFVASWREEERARETRERLFSQCFLTLYAIEKEERRDWRRVQQTWLDTSEELLCLAMKGPREIYVEIAQMFDRAKRRASQRRVKANEDHFDMVANKDTTRLPEGKPLRGSRAISPSPPSSEEREKARAARENEKGNDAQQVVTQNHSMLPDARPHPRHTQGVLSATSSPHPANQSRCEGANGKGKNKKDNECPRLKPLSAGRKDPYSEGWRALVGFLSDGERGKVPTHRHTPAIASTGPKNGKGQQIAIAPSSPRKPPPQPLPSPTAREALPHALERFRFPRDHHTSDTDAEKKKRAKTVPLHASFVFKP